MCNEDETTPGKKWQESEASKRPPHSMLRQTDTISPQVVSQQMSRLTEHLELGNLIPGSCSVHIM